MSTLSMDRRSSWLDQLLDVGKRLQQQTSASSESKSAMDSLCSTSDVGDWPQIDASALSEANAAADSFSVSTAKTGPKSNPDYWLDFEANVNDFAVAKSLVDFLSENKELQSEHIGLYLQAQIVIKRAQIVYAKRKEAEEREAAVMTVTRDRSAQPGYAFGKVVGELIGSKLIRTLAYGCLFYCAVLLASQLGAR